MERFDFGWHLCRSRNFAAKGEVLSLQDCSCPASSRFVGEWNDNKKLEHQKLRPASAAGTESSDKAEREQPGGSGRLV